MMTAKEFKVAGVSYRQDLVRLAKENDRVRLDKEENGAIAVKLGDDLIGFIPRENKSEIGQMLDEGYFARISKVINWLKDGEDQTALRLELMASQTE